MLLCVTCFLLQVHHSLHEYREGVLELEQSNKAMLSSAQLEAEEAIAKVKKETDALLETKLAETKELHAEKDRLQDVIVRARTECVEAEAALAKAQIKSELQSEHASEELQTMRQEMDSLSVALSDSHRQRHDDRSRLLQQLDGLVYEVMASLEQLEARVGCPSAEASIHSPEPHDAIDDSDEHKVIVFGKRLAESRQQVEEIGLELSELEEYIQYASSQGSGDEPVQDKLSEYLLGQQDELKSKYDEGLRQAQQLEKQVKGCATAAQRGKIRQQQQSVDGTDTELLGVSLSCCKQHFRFTRAITHPCRRSSDRRGPTTSTIGFVHGHRAGGPAEGCADGST